MTLKPGDTGNGFTYEGKVEWEDLSPEEQSGFRLLEWADRMANEVWWAVWEPTTREEK